MARPPVDWLSVVRADYDAGVSPTDQLCALERAWQSVPSDERDLFVAALVLELVAARMVARAHARDKAR